MRPWVAAGALREPFRDMGLLPSREHLGAAGGPESDRFRVAASQGTGRPAARGWRDSRPGGRSEHALLPIKALALCGRLEVPAISESVTSEIAGRREHHRGDSDTA